MITSMSRALAKAAARRFPPEAQVRREWLAELDYLAAQGRHFRMLRFAAGLAFIRPAHVPRVGFNWRTLGTALTLLAAPAALMLFALQIGDVISYKVPEWSFYLLFYAATLTPAVLVGVWRGARSVVIGPLPVAVLLSVTVSATLWAPSFVSDSGYGDEELVAGAALWAPALPLLLYAVGRIAQAGRALVAVLAGFVAWLVVLDVAVIVDFYPKVGNVAEGPPHGVIVGEHAPFWFVQALTGQSFGVLNQFERFMVNDMYFPHGLVTFGAYAICYAARACRVRQAREMTAGKLRSAA